MAADVTPRFLLSALLLTAQAAAAEPHLSHLECRLQDGQVHLSFQLAEAFDDALRERIASGLPTSLIFEMELLRPRRGWWDETLAAGELQVVAMYNAVTREYLLNTKLDGKLIESRSIAGEEQLQEAMATFSDLPFFQLGGVEAGTLLRVRGRTDLGSTTRWFMPRRVRTRWLDCGPLRVGDRPGGAAGAPP